MVAERMMPGSPDVEIRTLKSIEDCEATQPIMSRVWSPDIVVPYHMSFKIAKYGGVVLGAFIQGEMVGFALAFPMHQNYLYGLYLHMIGVLPEHHNARVGMRLMVALGQAAVAKGYRMLTWTFDPLESANARLYIGNLGAICNEYLPNYYGMLPDHRNQGAATDRFQVQWWVETPRVSLLLDHAANATGPIQVSAAGLNAAELADDARPVNEVAIGADGLLVGSAPQLDLKASDIVVRIPNNFYQLKQIAPDLAHQWRMQTREVFMAYFARGWTATGFLRGDNCNNYVLQR